MDAIYLLVPGKFPSSMELIDEEEVKDVMDVMNLVPDSYDLCPCASGKKV